MPFMT